jgi:Domain of unknown function (DUF932)
MGEMVESYARRVLVDASATGDPWWMTRQNHEDIANGTLEDFRFPGAIPREEVIRRLFASVTTIKGKGAGLFPISEEEAMSVGTGPVVLIDGEWHKVIVAGDRFATAVAQCSEDYGCEINYVGGAGYQVHDEQEWLMSTLPGLDVVAAGKLPDGTSWVQYKSAEVTSKHDGVSNKILAVTGNNGKLATSIRSCMTVALCTNTLAMSLSEGRGNAIKIKHSKYSDARLQSVQQSIDLMASVSERIDAEIDRLMSITVGDKDFTQSVKTMLGKRPEENGRGKTVWDSQFKDIIASWNGGVTVNGELHKVTPDKSAWNALQAIDTYAQWGRTVRGASRELRQDEGIISGKTYDYDMAFMDIVANVSVNRDVVPQFS